MKLTRGERTAFLRQRYGVLSDIARELKVSPSHVIRVSLGQSVSARVTERWNQEVTKWRASRESAA